MSTSTPRLRAFACSIALAAAFGGAYAAPASASAAADPPNYDGRPVGSLPVFPSTSLLMDRAALSSTSAAAHPGHPCYGQTDNPHNSTHFPGNVLASSRTVCVHSSTVTVDLYRVVFGVAQFLDRGTNSGAGTVSANARWACPSGSTFTFIAYGFHTAAGNHTPADTRNEQTVTCA